MRAILYIGAQCAGAISGCGTAAGVLDIQVENVIVDRYPVIECIVDRYPVIECYSR